MLLWTKEVMGTLVELQRLEGPRKHYTIRNAGLVVKSKKHYDSALKNDDQARNQKQSEISM